jgi:hypothetical protein
MSDERNLVVIKSRRKTCVTRPGGRFNDEDRSGRKSHGTLGELARLANISNDRVAVTHMFQTWLGEKKKFQR